MSHPLTRAACTAIAVALLAQMPCFAQPLPIPQEQPAVKDDHPPVDNPRDEWALPPQGNSNPDSWFSPENFWDLLSETPPHTFGRNQAAGFGFGEVPVIAPSYRVTWFPDAPVASQGTNLSSVSQDFRMVIPVYIDDCQMFGLTTGVRNVQYSTGAVLPGPPTQAFPDNLWDVRLGVTYKYTFANGWTTGGDISFGSASDQPFENVHQLTAGVSTFLRIPVGEHNAWLFSLSYSPTGELNFPIPGVAFYWQPSDSFNASIGVPFKVVWRPIEDVTLEAAYFPLTTVRGRASWRVWGGIYLYTAYDRGNESYFLANSSDDRERFFYYDERLSGGVKFRFGPHCILDLSSGYAFDRYFFTGDTSRNQQNNRVDVGDSTFLSLMLEVRF